MNVNIRDYIIGNTCKASELKKVCEVLSSGDTLCLNGIKLDVWADQEKPSYVGVNGGCVAFPIIGKRNVTIDGGGAELIMHDRLTMFAIDGSEDITVKNFKLDYANPYYAQADIIEADGEHVVLKFDGEEFSAYVNENGTVCFRGIEDGWESAVECGLCMEYVTETGAPSAYQPSYFYNTAEKIGLDFLAYMYKRVTAKNISDNVIELTGHFDIPHIVGNKWICMHGERENPAVFITRSRNVTVTDIDMHYSPSFGLYTVLSENITFERINVDTRPDSKRMMTLNADSTHFTDCCGDITIKDCKFVKMMDDGCNIHGTYLRDIKKVTDNSFIARYDYWGLNIFKKGDRVAILDMEDTRRVFESTVLKSVMLDNCTVSVTTADTLPEILDSYLAENLTNAPKVHISGTECGDNRPRGFLLSSAGAIVVENCKFHNMYQGIQLGGEMLDWYESGPTTNVTIINNNFTNSAYAGGYPILVMPHIKSREKAGSFHGKVLIEGNYFELHEKRFICTSNIGELIFKNNTYKENLSLPSRPVGGAPMVAVLCGKTVVDEPKNI